MDYVGVANRGICPSGYQCTMLKRLTVGYVGQANNGLCRTD